MITPGTHTAGPTVSRQPLIIPQEHVEAGIRQICGLVENKAPEFGKTRPVGIECKFSVWPFCRLEKVNAHGIGTIENDHNLSRVFGKGRQYVSNNPFHNLAFEGTVEEENYRHFRNNKFCRIHTD